MREATIRPLILNLLGGSPLRAPKNHTRGFTLIELLIVVAIIGVLATMLLSAIFSAKGKAQIGVAKSQIKSIQAALAMYEGDHGKFPRHTVRPTATPSASDACWRDDAPALYMALRNLYEEAYVLADFGARRSQITLRDCLGGPDVKPMSDELADKARLKVVKRAKYYVP